MAFNRMIFEKYRGKDFPPLDTDAHVYTSGGTFCDENVTISLQVDPATSLIRKIGFTGEMSEIGRANMHYLIEQSEGEKLDSIMDIQPDEYLAASFVPPHRAKQLLFSLNSLQNAVRHFSGQTQTIELEELMESI